jgi:hypothetical protein
MLGVGILSGDGPSVIMLTAVVLSAMLPSVIMLTVVMPSVLCCVELCWS